MFQTLLIELSLAANISGTLIAQMNAVNRLPDISLVADHTIKEEQAQTTAVRTDDKIAAYSSGICESTSPINRGARFMYPSKFEKILSKLWL